MRGDPQANSDPRFAAWLEASEVALAAEALDPETLERTLRARSELQHSLEAEPPPGPPAPELARRLSRAEARLLDALRSMREQLRTQIDELRHARSAASGYRPSHPNRPAFISKSV